MLYIKAIIFGIILSVIAGAWYYVHNLEKELNTARDNLATSQQNEQKLESSLKIQRETLEQTRKEITETRGLATSLRTVNVRQANELNKLRNKFHIRANSQSRDLGAIARVKPGLIQKIVNKATANVNRCFEIASGNDIKEGERNDECKAIITNGVN